MIACTSSGDTARSTPLTISVPSSSATCRFLSSSKAMFVTGETLERSGTGSPLVTQSSAALRASESTSGGVRYELRSRGHRRADAGERERGLLRGQREPKRRPRGGAARLLVEAAVGAWVAR